MKQYYKIAGLTVEMDSFGRTEDFARPYIVDYAGTPDIKIESDWAPWKEKNLSDNTCEYLASGRSFYSQLLQFDGILIHSSAIVKDGRAYLFSAPCGTGKSNHVSLWRRVFGDDQVRVLNDDKPALRLEDGVWYAYGTPWSGKTGQNLNLRVPLAGIALIERSEKNTIEAFNGVLAVYQLLGQTIRPADAAARIQILERLDQLLSRVPVWKLRCNMDPEAAIVAHKAMSGKENGL